MKSDEIYLSIKNLTKTFNGFKAVDNVSFNVKKGEIFGFLGPNGAGKTTTIKSILRIIYPDHGEVKFKGLDIKNHEVEIKKNIGFLPERISFYENLTPVQTLSFFCDLKIVDKSIIPSLIKDVGLEDSKDKKVGDFSKGMVQLLGVAQSTIGNPSIYILDEPMSGLDPRWVKVIREKIKSLNEQGATIIFSSHILSEVENLCHRVAIIDKGKIIAEDTVENLNKHVKIKPRLEFTIKNLNNQIPKEINKLKEVEFAEIKRDTLIITCDSSARIKVISALEKAGYKIENIKTIEPKLEDAFIKLIGGDA